MERKNKQKIGLALGSGGLRGLAHIGIIKVLLKNNIPIDYISGSSSGALVGAFLATYGEVDSLERLILENTKDLSSLFFDVGKGGIVGGNKISNFLEKSLGNIKFSETKIPLYIVSTDLISGQPVIFSSGKIIPAIRGSISVPVVFKPYSYEGKLLVDGGLSDPVPAGILKENGADNVVAINLYHKNEFKNKKFTVAKVALRSTRIALFNLAKISVSHADITLNPDVSYINKIKMKDYFKPENIKKIISIGEEETLRHLPEIKKIAHINE